MSLEHCSVLTPQSRIYLAGHRGLVGSAILRQLQAEGHRHIITRTHAELDLTDQIAVRDFFSAERPEYVFMAAAKVGGIRANNTYPAEFIHQNLLMEVNVIHAAWEAGVKRLLFLGSSCIYPKFAPQPMKEEYLLTGVLEPTNEPYAMAKIAGIKMCEAYNRQYGTRFFSVMPTNLYGSNDYFDPENSHVLPALIRRFHEAKHNNDHEVCIWGTGHPCREFLHVDDMADACLFVMRLPDRIIDDNLVRPGIPSFVNIGTGKDITIRELAELVQEIVGYPGKLVFDASRPDGTPRKLLDVSRMQGLGWKAKIGLREGITSTYQWFLQNLDQLRE